jgi:uncharacterized protein YmfQ (DUF2313 family)
MAILDYIYIVTEDGDGLTFNGADLIWEGGMAERREQLYGLVPYNREDFARALAALLPEGPVWPTGKDTVVQRLLTALAIEFERLDLRLGQLLAETDPASTTELLPDWERVVGLPDPCVTTGQTIAERRIALEGRLTSVGGQSRRFFIELAARLGYIVTIDEFASAADATAAGIAFTGDEWAHIWRVNVPTTVNIVPFRVGAGAVGEPLRKWSNEVIECQFNRFKPAHTKLLFAYSVGP